MPLFVQPLIVKLSVKLVGTSSPKVFSSIVSVCVPLFVKVKDPPLEPSGMVHDILKTTYQPFLIVRNEKRVLVEKISTAPCINNEDIVWTDNVKRLHKIVGE